MTGHRKTNLPAANKGLAKVAVQWLIEHLCFVSSAVLADSFVLRIRHLRQAPNVVPHCRKPTAHSSTFGFCRHANPKQKTKRA